MVSYLQHNCDHSEPRIANYAKWCLRHLRRSRTHVRRMPPSRAEITVRFKIIFKRNTEIITNVCYRPRTEYDGRLCFYRCLFVNRGRGVPWSSPDRGGVPKSTYPSLSKVSTPHPGPYRGRGTQGTYPPSRSKWGRGEESEGIPQGTYAPRPRYLHPSQGTYPPPPNPG